MGKTFGIKKKPSSKHSRAAKREASPSLDVDKSILNLPRPVSPTVNNPTGQPYHLLAAQGANGVSKKKKNKKESRNQRLRREKGLQRAEANLDILAVKREKSKDKGRSVRERSRTWDEIDHRMKDGKSRKKVVAEDNIDRMDEDEWEDEVDGMHDGHALGRNTKPAAKPSTGAFDENQMKTDEGEDEIT